MRTNIDIDDGLMDHAMRAGPFKTKKDAVEAGLKLLARQAAYREILKWEGKLQWDGDAEPDSYAGAEGAATSIQTGTGASRRMVANSPVAKPPASKPRHGRR